jgi:hypothetical protein
LIEGLRFIFKKAEEAGITFEGSADREELLDVADPSGEWFAPHQ